MSKFLFCFFLFQLPFISASSCEGAIVDSLIVQEESQDLFDAIKVKKQLLTQEGAPFNQIDFDLDLKKLSSLYRSVVPTVRCSDTGVSISISLEPKYILKQISISTTQSEYRLSEKKILATLKQNDLVVGSSVDHEKISKAIVSLRQLYAEREYPDAIIRIKEIPLPNSQVNLECYIKAGAKAYVEEIEIQGISDPLLQRQLLKSLQTKKRHFFSFLTGEGKLDSSLLEQDSLAAIHFLQSKGYLDATVSIQTEETSLGKRKVLLSVSLGNLYAFGDVRVEGNHSLEPEKIQKLIEEHLSSGSPYSQEKALAFTRILKDLYGEEGRIDTSIRLAYQHDLEKQLVHLIVHINESDIFRVGTISVRGNHSTETRVILHQLLFAPGHPYRTSEIQTAQERLMATGFFKQARVYPVKEGKSHLGPGYRDLIIEVEEKYTTHVSLSGNITSSQSFGINLEFSESNFNHQGLFHPKKGWSSLRGGGELLNIKAQLGSESSYTLAWLDPHYRDTAWRLGTDLSYYQNNLQSKKYTIKSLSWQLYTGYAIFRSTDLGLKLRVRDSFTTFDPLGNPSFESQKQNNGFVVVAGPSLSIDTTDHPFRPTRGLRSSWEIEGGIVERRHGSPDLFPIVRFLTNTSHYIPLNKRITFKSRFNYKTILPMGEGKARFIPLTERFFLGGASDIRGIQFRGMGPKFLTPLTPIKEPDGTLVYPPDPRPVGSDGQALRLEDEDPENPTGGITSICGSFELSCAVAQPVDFFLFIDAGALSMKRTQIGPITSTTGFGLRININGMPFMIGLAKPLQSRPETKSVEESFFWSFSGYF